MNRYHVIELRSTATQGQYLSRCAGTMRFVYNALVAKWMDEGRYNRGEFQKHCIAMRRATPWMREVSSRATYEAADNFDRAAKNFFKSCSGERKGKKIKRPTFKKKGRSSDSVKFSHSTQFSVNGRSLRVAGLAEEIAMREIIRFTGAVKSVSIKHRGGKWFASFLVELLETPPDKTTLAQKPSVGVDLGLKALAALSTGELIENPKPLRKKLRLLRRRQRQVSSKFVKGKKQSHRHKIASERVSRLHKKVADQRSDAQHKLTSSLVNRFSRIVIEDLAVSNMLKNKRLSRAISDAGWCSIRKKLEYKSKAFGVELVVADRFFASSKICSCCGHKVENISLRTRTFRCQSCGLVKDRDVNAAVNLSKYVPPSRPIMARRKTRALASCKSSPQGVAGAFDGANINLQPEVAIKPTCGRVMVI